MGKPKGLLEFKTGFWLEEQLRRLTECGITRVSVVLGFEYQKYLTVFPKLAIGTRGLTEWKGLKIDVSLNMKPERGPFSSLQTGLLKVCEDPGANSCFILPLDVPAASADVWLALVENLKEGFKVATPRFQGRGGHPVFISKTFADELLNINPESPEARLDLQIAKLSKSEVSQVIVNDPQVIENLNTPEKYSEFLQKYG
jgi:molybdenum cofactor cytidylyltransferase